MALSWEIVAWDLVLEPTVLTTLRYFLCTPFVYVCHLVKYLQYFTVASIRVFGLRLAASREDARQGRSNYASMLRKLSKNPTDLAVLHPFPHS